LAGTVAPAPGLADAGRPAAGSTEVFFSWWRKCASTGKAAPAAAAVLPAGVDLPAASGVGLVAGQGSPSLAAAPTVPAAAAAAAAAANVAAAAIAAPAVAAWGPMTDLPLVNALFSVLHKGIIPVHLNWFT